MLVTAEAMLRRRECNSGKQAQLPWRVHDWRRAMFWRPAYEWRGTRKPWFTNTKLMNTELSELATRAIYRCFNLVPDLVTAANDRDGLRW